jgi:3-oxoacyl-[acyl-carrier protein] reductase
MDLQIAGRVALVCGSSSGLGRAIAATLVRERCRVALNGRDPKRLDAAVQALRRHAGDDVVGIPGDVSVPAEAASLVDRARHELGSVDILVCNAGGPPAAPFAETPPDAWQAALDLNLLSTIHLCRAAVPLMRKREWGRIVCLTSVAAREPLPGLILSTTARAGVLGFAKSLSDEVAAEGITVNCVCPGYMHTERVEELVEARATRDKRSTQEVLAGMLTKIPMGRMGEPDELAAAVAFLASEPARYITGAVLQVDGGYIRSVV